MFLRFIKDVKNYYHYIIYCTKSELKTEVANSYLNWLWWILNPLCFMLIYSFVFGTLFNAREQYFNIFIFIGITMWDFFNNTTKSCVKLIKSNKAIVDKVYIPKYVLIFIKMGVNGVKMAIGFGIIVIMMLYYRITPTPLFLWLIPILLTLFVVTFSFSAFLMHFGVYVEDLSNIWTIVLRMVFYMTGIFYNVETRAKELGPILIKVNPIALLLKSARDVLLYQTAPHYLQLFVWFLVFLVISILGIYMIYKNENSYVKSV
jgi:ABC-type polysaccharide/polyol phosphate export permease